MFDTLLTDFVGADENPLSDGGNWATTFTTRDPLQRKSNTAQPSTGSNPNYSHWTTPFDASLIDPLEVFACSEGGQLGAALETWRINLWTTVGGTSVNGYELYFGGGLSKNWVLNKWVSSSGTNLDTAPYTGYPERIGLRLNGSEVEGWGMFASTWTLMVSATDTEFRNDLLYASLALEDPTSAPNFTLFFTCFGGGAPRRKRTQIYRWIGTQEGGGA